MVSTCKSGRRRDKSVGLLATSIFLLCSGMQAAPAYAAKADAPTTMRYGGSAGFGSSVNFDLLAVDTGLDDCDDLPAAAERVRDDSDTILLAKLDTEKKSRSKSKSSSAGSTAKDTPAPAAAPVAVDLTPTEQMWEIIVSDKTLNAAMARWAAQAGWQLLWELPVDYSVDARTTVRGSFEEAVNTVAKSMESAEIPMKAVFYQGNKVLRIMSKGSE